MNRYQRGKIYKITSRLTDSVYVGSTTEPTLAKRLGGHVRDFRCWEQGKRRYVSGSFAIIKTGDYRISLLESYPCTSRDELLARESYWIDRTENCVNKHRPGALREAGGRTAYVRANMKKYYRKHRQRILTKRKAKREMDFDQWLKRQHRIAKFLRERKTRERAQAWRKIRQMEKTFSKVPKKAASSDDWNPDMKIRLH